LQPLEEQTRTRALPDLKILLDRGQIQAPERYEGLAVEARDRDVAGDVDPAVRSPQR
jgi:hypothetical protein